MTATDTQCLNAFPVWLDQLAADALDLLSFLEGDGHPDHCRLRVASGLNYLLKSLDLIPDGVEDLGMLDDAFVLRVTLAEACGNYPDAPAVVARLGGEAELIHALLEEDFARLQAYVRGLEQLEVRGRTPHAVLADPEARASLSEEIRAWAKSYRAPNFSRDEKNLIKLRSFLRTKLPKAGAQSGLPGIQN